MARKAAVLVLIGLALMGCQDGLDLLGSIDGHESFGSSGGTMQTPDGIVEVEVERGALAGEIEFSVGRLDDCMPRAVGCYEIEPAGLTLDQPVTVSLDVADLVSETGTLDAPQELTVYVQSRGRWIPVGSSTTDSALVTVELETLGPVALVPTT